MDVNDGSGWIVSAIDTEFQANPVDITIANNIVRGVTNATGNWFQGIRMCSTYGTVNIYNNIFYDFKSTGWGGGGNGVGICGGTNNIQATVNLYNNTSYGNGTGFLIEDGGSPKVSAKNNLSYNNTDAFLGSFVVASSTNNLSGPSQIDAPGSNPRNAITVSFIDAANYNFHLSPCDTGAKDYGADLSYDKYLPFSTDIDGQSRSGAWDIGADEYNGDNVRGYAWSSNYGWISMSCLNDSSCGVSNYGVKICNAGCAPSNKFNFFGYGWSSGAGWISFNSTGAP